MAVFLTILKILLWILLIILGIAILLILLILFAPIRYKISGELNDEKMQADAKISFLIASVKAGFTKESGLDYAARVLGIKIYPRGSGNKKPKKKTEEITSDNEEIDDSIFDPVSNADFEAWEAEHYPEDKEVIEPIMSTKEDIKAHKKKIKAEKAQEKKAEKERQKAEKVEASAKTEIHSEGGENTSADENKEVVPILDRLDTVINFAGDKLEVVTEKADKVKQKAVEGIDKAQIKIDHVVKFFEKPFTQKTIARGKKLLVKVIKSIKPKKSRADIVFGMGSPADTGAMMGKIAFIYPYTYKWLNITPDFYRKGVEGTIDLKGKLRLASIIFPALRILLSRDFKRTMKLAKKI